MSTNNETPRGPERRHIVRRQDDRDALDVAIADAKRGAAELARLTTLRDVGRALFHAGHFEAAKMVEEMQSQAAGPVAKAAGAYLDHALGNGRWDAHVRAENEARVQITEAIRQGAVGPYMTLTAIGNSARLFGGGR